MNVKKYILEFGYSMIAAKAIIESAINLHAVGGSNSVWEAVVSFVMVCEAHWRDVA